MIVFACWLVGLCRDARQESRSLARRNLGADTQPRLHSAFLRLSAIISQYFTGRGAFTDCSGLFAVGSYSVQAARSLSAPRQLALQFAFAGEQWSLPALPLCAVLR